MLTAVAADADTVAPASPEQQLELQQLPPTLPPLPLHPPLSLQLPPLPLSSSSSSSVNAATTTAATTTTAPATTSTTTTYTSNEPALPPSVASSVSLLRRASVAFLPKILAARFDHHYHQHPVPTIPAAPSAHAHAPIQAPTSAPPVLLNSFIQHPNTNHHDARIPHLLPLDPSRLQSAVHPPLLYHHQHLLSSSQIPHLQMDFQMHLNIQQQQQQQFHIAQPPVIPTPDSDASDPNADLLSLQRHYKAIFDFEDIVDSTDPDEYGYDIYNYMIKLENFTMTRPTLMHKQTEINWKMRKTLILWLVDVQIEYDLRQETLYLTINIIDRMCSIMQVARSHYQLLGIASLWIAAKYEENHGKVPTIQNLVHMCCRIYRESEILNMERTILRDLRFELGVPTHEAFLKALYALHAGNNVSPESRAMARYIMELSLIDRSFVGERPSNIAHASLFLAEEVVGSRHWYENERVEQRDLMRRLYTCLKTPPRQISEKFSSEKFLNSSELARSFVLAEGHRLARYGNSNRHGSGPSGGMIGEGHPTPPKDIFTTRWIPYEYMSAATAAAAAAAAAVANSATSAIPSAMASVALSSPHNYKPMHSDAAAASVSHGHHFFPPQMQFRTLPFISSSQQAALSMMHLAPSSSSTTANDSGIASDVSMAMSAGPLSVDNMTTSICTSASSLSAITSAPATAPTPVSATSLAPSPAVISCLWNMIPMQQRQPSSSAASSSSSSSSSTSSSSTATAHSLLHKSHQLSSMFSSSFGAHRSQTSAHHHHHHFHHHQQAPSAPPAPQQQQQIQQQQPYLSQMHGRSLGSGVNIRSFQDLNYHRHQQQQFASYRPMSAGVADTALDTLNSHIWAA